MEYKGIDLETEIIEQRHLLAMTYSLFGAFLAREGLISDKDINVSGIIDIWFRILNIEFKKEDFAIVEKMIIAYTPIHQEHYKKVAEELSDLLKKMLEETLDDLKKKRAI